MSYSFLGKVLLNNDTTTTSVSPLGLAVFFSPFDESRDLLGAGYFFDSYTRPIFIEGNTSKTLFWDYCEKCPLYENQLCSGGAKVFRTQPGHQSYLSTNESGERRNIYYNKEFCKIHYGTPEYYQILEKQAPEIIKLLPHFFMTNLCGESYWFNVKSSQTGGLLQLLPYRIFNTWNSGKVCFGGVLRRDRFSVTENYELFLGAKMNSELMPEGLNENHFEWAVNYSVEDLLQRSNHKWGNFQRVLGAELLLILPPTFTKIVFLKVSGENLSPELLGDTSLSSQVVPFLREPGGSWRSAFSIATEILDTTLLNFLEGDNGAF